MSPDQSVLYLECPGQTSLLDTVKPVLMSTKMGGHPMGGHPMGGHPMGGHPMGGHPMGGQSGHPVIRAQFTSERRPIL